MAFQFVHTKERKKRKKWLLLCIQSRVCYFLTLNYHARQFYECVRVCACVCLAWQCRHCLCLAAALSLSLYQTKRWVDTSTQNAKQKLNPLKCRMGNVLSMRPNHYHSDRLSNYRWITWIMTNFIKYFANNACLCQRSEQRKRITKCSRWHFWMELNFWWNARKMM